MHRPGTPVARTRLARATGRTRRNRRTWMTGLARAVLGSLVAGTAACSSIIGVEESPSRVDANGVEVPANAALLVDGAIANFECALANYITGAGLVGEELEWATTSPWGREYDRRSFSSTEGFYATQTCDSGLGIYKPLSTARWQADNTLKLLQGWTDEQVPARQALIATVAAYSGYAHVLLGEGMCSAAFDLGPEVMPPEMFARAEDRFTTALAAAQSAALPDITNLALVGRSRTRLNLGRKADAATDAKRVPNGFVFTASYGSAPFRRSNFVFRYINQDEGVVVGELFRTLTVAGVPETRLPIQYLGRTAVDRTTPLWVQTKYSGLAASIPIATWREASLIAAEAELGQSAVAAINALRAPSNLPLFSSTDNAEILQQVLYERRVELFLEGQALGDIRRLKLPLSPAAGAPYPGGGTYGSETCFPLPMNERLNNPNIS